MVDTCHDSLEKTWGNLHIIECNVSQARHLLHYASSRVGVTKSIQAYHDWAHFYEADNTGVGALFDEFDRGDTLATVVTEPASIALWTLLGL